MELDMTEDYRKFVERGVKDNKYWVDFWDPEREPPPKIVRRELEKQQDADNFYNELMGQ